MTVTPTPEPPDNNPERPQRPPSRRRWLWWLLLGLAGASGGWIGFWMLLQQVAQPFIEKQVSNTLERPVEMGEITKVSLNRLHFGPTRLPVQDDDADHAIAEAVEVRFTPLKIVLQRRLELDITLKDSAAYIEQDEVGQWFHIPTFEEGNLPIKIRVTAIRIQDANLDVVKRNVDATLRDPIELEVERGDLLIYDGAKDMEINALIGEFKEGGWFRVDGPIGMEGGLPGLEGQLVAQLKDVNLVPVTRILPPLPVKIEQGYVSGNTNIIIKGHPFKLDTLPDFYGIARMKDVVVRSDLVKPLVTVSRGDLRLQGNVAQVDGWRTKLGEIPVYLDGGISTDETLTDFTVRLAATPVTDLIETFEIENFPVPVSGSIALAATLTGPIEQPVVVGRVVDACIPNEPCDRLQVDRVPLASLLVDFKTVLREQVVEVTRAQIKPQVGGTITAKGGVDFKAEVPTGIAEIAFNDLPTDRFLSAYGVSLPVPLGRTSGQAQAYLPVRDWRKLRATATANLLGGTVTVGNVQLTKERWAGTAVATNLRLPNPIPTRDVTARLRIGGRMDSFRPETFTVAGQAQARLPEGQITASRIVLNQGAFSTQVEAQNANVAAIAANLLPSQVKALGVSNVNGTMAIAGQLRGTQLPDLVGRGQMTLGLAGGVATLQGLRLQNNQLTAQANAQQLQLAQVSTIIPANLPINRQALGQVNADINLVANLAPLLQGNVQAILRQTNLTTIATIANLSGGQGRANFNLNQGQWTAAFTGTNIQAQRVMPQLPATVNQITASRFQFQGTVPQQFDLNSLQAQGSGSVQLPDGSLQLPSIQLAGGNLTAQAIPQNIPLRPFSSLLRGQLVGNVRLNVPLRRPTAFTAQGTVNLDRGISIITNALAATFQWRNNRLTLNRLDAGEQLTASGYVDVNLDAILQGAIGPNVIRQVNLDVDANQLPLNAGLTELQQFLPLPAAVQQVAVWGLASFDGTVRGSLQNPNVQGNVTLANLALNRWVFDDRLAGPVSIDSSGVSVNLTGERDRLQVALDSAYRPTGFNIQLPGVTATGTRQGDILMTQVENVELARVKPFLPAGILPPTIAAQPLAGELSGRFDVNLNNWGVAGNVVVENPVVGPLQAESFTGGLQYINGAIALQDAQLTTGDTRYVMNGRFVPFGPNPQVQGRVDIEQGDVQDVLAALQIAELSDVLQLARTFGGTATGSAANLDTVAVGEPNATISDQLSRLSEILALNAQNERDSIDALPFPALKYAEGELTGSITFGGSLKEGFSGLQGQVNLQGQDWEWGNYVAETVTLQGRLEEGAIAIQPFELQTGEGSILLSGVFGNDNINGQLQIKDLPILTLQDLIPLPPAIGLGGEINATTTLAGDRANPQLQGRVNITDANVNDTPIDTATANFNYNNARLNFGARSTLQEEGTPLTVTGRIPFQIPIPGTTPPKDYGLEINTNLENDGLAILNILTRQQIVWRGGTGKVQVKVLGQLNPETRQLDTLVADGTVTIADGVVGSALLPEPITDLNGQIDLNFDQIDIPGLTGAFGGGAIAIAGSLPTFQRIPQANPLTVQLDQLAVVLEGLFEGEINGQVQVLGTALAPDITGKVGVSDGQVQLLGLSGEGTALGGAEEGSSESLASRVTFRDFNITLTNDFVLKQFPVLEFAARGDLTLNGSFPNLEPQGDIDLTRGYLNLFTTTFRLDNDYRNQALFSPITGLDPYLDLRLVGSVLETRRQTFAVETTNSEIDDRSLNLGSIQALRVRADVQASALELVDTLRASNSTGLRPNNSLISLSSSPGRSETELLALIGGSFVSSVAGGDSTALVGGLANIAGNALLGGLQRAVTNSLGLSEFRIFPAQVISDDEEDSNSGTLGIAMEVGKTIGSRASVSIFRFITPGDQPTRFNVRYRLSDNLTIRSSTDLQGDNRAVLEYEARF